ncbi:MAG: cytochrome c biogenesis protein CcdA [Candidatus Margulisiibacteriota bacterium]
MNFLIAFGGGILAFFSPCFLPLVPAYLIYITGMSFDEIKDVRLKTIIHSLLFILGFGVVFTLLGLAAGLFGGLLFELKDILRVLSGGLIILLGLYLAGILKLPFLDIEKRITISKKPSGYLGTFFVGMGFALGWTPCIGPILAGILTLAAQSGKSGQGALMLASFSLGLGLPIFLVSLALDFSLSLIKRIEKYLGAIHFICGLLLVIIGILLATNYLQSISIWLIDLTGYKGI